MQKDWSEKLYTGDQWPAHFTEDRQKLCKERFPFYGLYEMSFNSDGQKSFTKFIDIPFAPSYRLFCGSLVFIYIEKQRDNSATTSAINDQEKMERQEQEKLDKTKINPSLIKKTLKQHQSDPRMVPQ